MTYTELDALVEPGITNLKTLATSQNANIASVASSLVSYLAGAALPGMFAGAWREGYTTDSIKAHVTTVAAGIPSTVDPSQQNDLIAINAAVTLIDQCLEYTRTATA